MVLTVLNKEFYQVSEIIKDKLYLSGILPIFYNGPYLKKYGITHVISITEFKKPSIFEMENFTTLHIQLNDNKYSNIYKYFYSTNTFIEDCLSKGGKILIHCIAGISRSTTIVVAYLLYKGIPLPNAITHVKTRRSIINPNEGFMGQLCAFAHNRSSF